MNENKGKSLDERENFSSSFGILAAAVGSAIGLGNIWRFPTIAGVNGGGAFLIISILLINSSIRLSVYSKRFVIKTMQMVGATKRFIRKPFIWKNIQLGFIGSILAIVALGFVLYYLDLAFPELLILDQELLLAGLFIGIFVLGIFISWLSTFFATQRFLNLRTDDLFY